VLPSTECIFTAKLSLLTNFQKLSTVLSRVSQSVGQAREEILRGHDLARAYGRLAKAYGPGILEIEYVLQFERFNTLASGWFRGFSCQNNQIPCGFACA